MPLLAKEIDVFPEDIFSLPAGDFRWYLAHVRSRQETVCARHLLQKQIACYLPQIERLTERSSRRFRSHVPLFAGYVFLREFDRPVLRWLRQ